MHKLIYIGITTLLLSSCSSVKSTIANPEMIGLWQYQDKEMWIQIDKRGRVFQCRIGFSRETFTSKGKLNTDNAIEWENIWEPSPVEIVKNSLIVDDLFGELRFDRTVEEMALECDNPIE